MVCQFQNSNLLNDYFILFKNFSISHFLFSNFKLLARFIFHYSLSISFKISTLQAHFLISKIPHYFTTSSEHRTDYTRLQLIDQNQTLKFQDYIKISNSQIHFQYFMFLKSAFRFMGIHYSYHLLLALRKYYGHKFDFSRLNQN